MEKGSSSTKPGEEDQNVGAQNKEQPQPNASPSSEHTLESQIENEESSLKKVAEDAQNTKDLSV
ncbi:hypothetical protein A2U01_0101912, partial [Trifolium medium]|nr:hypothetical protein [Trifolium medium]